MLRRMTVTNGRGFVRVVRSVFEGRVRILPISAIAPSDSITPALSTYASL